MKKNNFLYVKKEKVEVEEKIYAEFNKLVCRQKNITRRYIKYTAPLETMTDQRENIEDEAIKNILIEQLHKALKQLDDEEYRLIFELFFNGRSERSLAQDWDVHPMTIHSKKGKILEKLKKILKK